MEDASGRRLYVCLRCGNKFWSRAKKPQCSVCRSKRVIPYEEFLQLPQEEQERILGKRKEKNEEQVEAAGLKEGEAEGNSVKIEESPEGERVKSGDSPGEIEGKSVKTGESPKITPGERVKSGDSPKITGVKEGEKQRGKVKGERVKRGISIPKPRLSWKALSLILGVAFIYYLYKVGWFDAMLDHLKFLKTSSEAVEAYEKEPRRRDSPVLERISKNLGG